jgi:hypothetical protein
MIAYVDLADEWIPGQRGRAEFGVTLDKSGKLRRGTAISPSTSGIPKPAAIR